jgi:ribose-phosphate pyrophosphokinase
MRKIALIAGDAHPKLAHQIAELTGAAETAVSISAFADGETRIRIEADVRDSDVYIVQPTSTPTNERLLTIALLADAARADGASRITAVVPYFGYARQDVRSRPGEPRSARLAAQILGNAGIDRLIAFELHSAALESAFPMPVAHLQADELMLPAIRRWGLRDAAIVSPDAGGLKRAQRFASALRAPLAVVAKIRPGDDAAVAGQVLGDVRGRPCVIVDDMASTGGTIVAAGEALLAAGAAEIHAVFIHAVMARGALERICAVARRIATTDSVDAAGDPRLQVEGTAPLLARAVRELAGIGGRANPPS